MLEMPKIANLPRLTQEESDDARFRIQDRFWALLGDLFDEKSETEQLTYAEVGRRIGRSRSQVHRWFSSAHNMNLASAGLLAEGLDVDVVIKLEPRATISEPANHIHPCEDARTFVVASKPRPSANASSSGIAAVATSSGARSGTIASLCFHAS